MKSSLHGCGSADPRFRGPRFFRGATDTARTPRQRVRATRQALHSLRLQLGFLEAGDTFGFVVVDIEDGVELGNLKKVMNLLGKIQKLQLSALV